jgi:hypothetical protein
MHSFNDLAGAFTHATLKFHWSLMAFTPFAELQIEAIADCLADLELCNELEFSCTDRESYARTAVQRLCDLGLARGVAISHNDGPSQIAVDYVGPLPRGL